MFHRRDFLRRSLTTSSLLACGLHVPAFLGRTAALAPLAGKLGSQDTLLVVVQLTGGNDGLNTVIPFKDPLYAQYRPTLKLPTDQLKKLDDQHGLHPALEGLAELYQDQALCVVQGVGYPNPSQSHFRSMDIWHAGSTADTLTEGWLGRAMSRMNPAHGFHVGAANEATPLALAGAPAKVPTLTRLEDFQLRTLAGSGTDRQEQKKLIEASVATPDRAGGLLDFVKRTAVSTYASSDRLRELVRGYEPKVAYPETGLGNRLKLVAQLIEANLGARIFYVSIDGFDTHATQAEAHANLLREVSGAITAFHKDLTARGHGDRLLTMTFSEFGRRAKENGSKGTDHGSAAPLFLVGKKVKPGIIGAHPRLDRLDDGNLVHHTDFRQVYAAILDRWLGVPSAEILGSGFKPADVLA